ncbi:MAG: glutathione S-transferase N-terminal domain-containing protein [Afipia sp.]
MALEEAGLPFDLVQLTESKEGRGRRRLPGGESQGKVPALGLTNGDLLTEGAVIVQMIAIACRTSPPARPVSRRARRCWKRSRRKDC